MRGYKKPETFLGLKEAFYFSYLFDEIGTVLLCVFTLRIRVKAWI